MKHLAQFSIFIIAGAGLFLFFTAKNDFKLSELSQTASEQIVIENTAKDEENLKTNLDLPPQKPLENPPEAIKAVYATGWTAGGVQGLNRMINLIKSTELNAIILDIKDYSGELSYRTEITEVEEYSKDRDLKILRPNAMIKSLHDEGIYVIARQTVFQDPILAAARPELALHSKQALERESVGWPGSENSNAGDSPIAHSAFRVSTTWLDNKKVMWMDSASKEVWDYNIVIAKDALARGFDEVNFDYIRFASDGNLDDIVYPFWDEVTLKRTVMREFWKYLRQALPGAKISADLFGLVTVNYGDVGIGQNIEDAFHYFDAVAPMVYPSHYSSGFDGYKNPAEHPYGVVLRSMEEANRRLKVYKQNAALSTSTEKYLVKEPKLRPWLQDFDLGADYDAGKVRDQIMATYAAEGACEKVATTTDLSGFLCDEANLQKSGGWMLWDPRNVYTREALLAE